MKKFVFLVPLLVAAMCLPLFLAAFLATGVAPAAAAQVQAIGCTSAPVPATGTWRAPFAQAYVKTSGYGKRFDPIYQRTRLHAGQDLASLPGPGPVVAASAGTVVAAGAAGGLGNFVVIDNGAGVQATYGHLSKIAAGITTGATIWMGQTLGTEGSTGASTGDHLHFELHVGGTPVDPVPFMLAHGAPLDGKAIAASPPPGGTPPVLDPRSGAEGGIGFALPRPGTPRQQSLHNPALPIPADIKADYVRAAGRYQIPWTLLAGIGMEETGHGRNNTTSSAGAQGLMQFIPATWATYGVDGDDDGTADIGNDADQAMSAANYLTTLGVSRSGGPDGVRNAIFGYNHATWYVNDVLFYTHAYGGGTVLGDPSDCGPAGNGNPDLPPMTNQRINTLLTWAQTKKGDPYLLGAGGPNVWDCSSFTKAAFAHVGVTMPRTASAQRDWLAKGNGFRVPYGQEKPGDLIFIDSYLGPNQIGHVAIVKDSARHLTIEAGGTRVGNYDYSNWTNHHIFQIWRPGNLSDHPPTQKAPSPSVTKS